jgi:molybdopterin-guanine dinucleotide biosynthesis protein A
MGSDKGLLVTSEGHLWAQNAFNKMAALQIPVSLVVNRLQYASYAAAFAGTTIITDNENLELHGPLLGVLSAHLQYPVQNLFVLACDMPLMETIVLTELYNKYLESDAYDAFVFTDEEEPEPLCAIYCAQGLSAIADMHKKGLLQRHSMKSMIENLNVCFLPITSEQKTYFTNVNAHADLNGS